MTPQTSRQRKAGFTLVEMLVVISIIAILAALLLPAVTAAITSARNTAIALELNQLNSAIEAYRLEKGDYPPNFRDINAVRRHIAKCYPRADSTYVTNFIIRATTQGSNPDLFIDEGESMVFWLSMTDKNPQYPFLLYYNPQRATLAPDPKRYYDFDQTRLTPSNPARQEPPNLPPNSPQVITMDVPSFQARYCKETNYIYIDSRSYALFTAEFSAAPPAAPVFAYADDPTAGVRPYWTSTTNATNPGATLNRDKYQAAKPTAFQVICAGQDGDFGLLPTDIAKAGPKVFPDGLYYNPADKDNITSFSNGRTLGDSIP
jgi:prepilin-type N-terminal cleavage/methylation domain-containing protein